MSDPEKLSTLIQIEGYQTLEDFLEEHAHDSIITGICTNPDCEYTTGVEPDARDAWCELCEQGSVASALILAGLI